MSSLRVATLGEVSVRVTDTTHTYTHTHTNAHTHARTHTHTNTHTHTHTHNLLTSVSKYTDLLYFGFYKSFYYYFMSDERSHVSCAPA